MKDNSNSKLLVALGAVLLAVAIGLAAYALSRGNEPVTTTESNSVSADDVPSTSTIDSPQSVSDNTVKTDMPTIVFTDNGFEQETYTFPAGQTIVVKNASSKDMQFSSDDHPAHRDHPEMNLRVLGEGESATFTPSGKGTYGFHDHINDQYEGTLIIE